KAYPVLLSLLPAGLKGLSFAALTAAVVASLAGKANSISTIFTLDIFKNYFAKNATEQQLVNIGRWVVVVSMVIAIIASPYMGIEKKGGLDRKSTRLNSSHVKSSYAVFCLKKKK